MRKINLSDGDFALFDFELSQDEYVFFERHKKTFLDMWTDQGQQFWFCFVMTFRTFNEKHGKLFHTLNDTDAEVIFDELFDFIEDQFCVRERQSKKLIEDIAILAQFQSSIRFIDSKSYSKDPFYMKESREVFRKFFGNPDAGLASLKGSMNCSTVFKVCVLSPIYLRFGGSVCRCLQRWLDAPIANCKDFNYYKPVEKMTERKEKKTEKKSLTVYMCDDCQRKYEKVFEEEKKNGRPDRPRFIEFWYKGDPRFEDEHNPLYNPSAKKDSDWRTDTSENKFKEFVLYTRTLYGAPDEKCRKCHNLSKKETAKDKADVIEPAVNGEIIDKDVNAPSKKKKKKKKKKNVENNNDNEDDDYIIQEMGFKEDTQQKHSNFQFQFNKKVTNQRVELQFHIIIIEEKGQKKWEKPEYLCTKIFHPLAVSLIRSVLEDLPKKFEWYEGCGWCVAVMNYEEEEKQCKSGYSDFLIKASGLKEDAIKRVMELCQKQSFRIDHNACGGITCVLQTKPENRIHNSVIDNYLDGILGVAIHPVLLILSSNEKGGQALQVGFPEEDDLKLCFLPEVMQLELAGLDMTIYKGYNVREILTTTEKSTQFDFKALKGRMIPLWWSGEENSDMFKETESQFIKDKLYSLFLGNGKNMNKKKKIILTDTGSYCHYQKGYATIFDKRGAEERFSRIIDRKCVGMDNKNVVEKYAASNEMLWVDLVTEPDEFDMFIDVELGTEVQYKYLGFFSAQMKFYLTKNMTLKWDLHKILTVCGQTKCGCGLRAVLNIGKNCPHNTHNKSDSEAFLPKKDFALRNETKQLFQEEFEDTLEKMGNIWKERAEHMINPGTNCKHRQSAPISAKTKTVDGINSTINLVTPDNGQSFMHVKVRINPESEYSSKNATTDQILQPTNHQNNKNKTEVIEHSKKNNMQPSSEKCKIDCSPATKAPCHSGKTCNKCHKMLPNKPSPNLKVAEHLQKFPGISVTADDVSLTRDRIDAPDSKTTEIQLSSSEKIKVSGKFTDILDDKIKSHKVENIGVGIEEKQIDDVGNRITKCTEQLIKTSSDDEIKNGKIINIVPPPSLQKADEKSLLRNEQKEKMPEAPTIKASLTTSPVVHKTDGMAKEEHQKNAGEGHNHEGAKEVSTPDSGSTAASQERSGEKIVVVQSIKNLSKTEGSESKSQLRKCFGCGAQEAEYKTYKKCQRCKQEHIKNARYYCGKNCQVADWSARHKLEHSEGQLI